jgi:hypothetical protein
MACQSIYLTMRGLAAAQKRYHAAKTATCDGMHPINPSTLVTTTPGQDVTGILGLRLWHRGKWHLCCWAWKLALIIPLIHFVLHLCGVPHPEGIGFIP